ncbi:MAG TPA: sigma-70 family RNA polymerase sigma factor [Vicinamibacterales bacterium]|nr:sigma-70 family RNA polymerase sigma factor [Vicinamibacterales bacterium]
MTIRDMTVSDVERLAGVAEAETTLAMTEDAFRAFYDRTARPVWGYLARLTGDRALADDLLQETFYRFLRSGATPETEAHRRNTLFKIATNLARDAHRRRRVRPFFLGDLPDVASHEDAAVTFEQTTDVGRAMRALKPRDRAMLWLAYAEGSSHQEIAGVMGVQTASVKLLLFRARRRLAALLSRPAVKGGA